MTWGGGRRSARVSTEADRPLCTRRGSAADAPWGNARSCRRRSPGPHARRRMAGWQTRPASAQTAARPAGKLTSARPPRLSASRCTAPARRAARLRSARSGNRCWARSGCGNRSSRATDRRRSQPSRCKGRSTGRSRTSRRCRPARRACSKTAGPSGRTTPPDSTVRAQAGSPKFAPPTPAAPPAPGTSTAPAPTEPPPPAGSPVALPCSPPPRPRHRSPGSGPGGHRSRSAGRRQHRHAREQKDARPHARHGTTVAAGGADGSFAPRAGAPALALAELEAVVQRAHRELGVLRVDHARRS